jgi:hypothetical protein
VITQPIKTSAGGITMDKEIEKKIREYCQKTDCMKCPREESDKHPCFTIALKLGDVKNEGNKK